jgi:putative spermidine/putrescine transport system substrate-binding protein
VLDHATRRALRRVPTHRTWLKVAAMTVTASLVVGACGSAASTASTTATTAPNTATTAPNTATTAPNTGPTTPPTTGKVVINVSTGAFADAIKWALIRPFQEKTGIQVTTDEREPDLAVLQAMMESGQPPTLDVYNAVPNGIPGDQYSKYLEPIDWSVVNKGDLLPGFYGDTWIASSVDSYVLGYNTKATGGKAPTGWADLFDLKSFPGKRMFEDRWETTCMITLLADGVAPDKLVPIDVDRCLKKLATIRAQIVWFQSGSENQELLASGEVTMGMAFNGRVKAGVNEGAPVAAVWKNQLVEFAQFGVVKGSPNKAAAMQFIALATSREFSGALTEFLPYPGVNKYQTIYPSNAAWVPSAHFDTPYAQIDTATKDWVNGNYAKYNPLFQAFKTGS